MTRTSFPGDEKVKAAYFYLMGRAIAIRQERLDVSKTPYNAIKYNPLGSESADFVNPNLDVAYLEAWIAVDERHAVILHVPRIEGRYYTIQVMDGWGEVIANVNERNNPEHPFGAFAFMLAGMHPDVPEGIPVIELPCSKVKLLARVELSHDPREAVTLQHAFELEVPEGIRIDEAPAVPAFQNPQLPGAWIFEDVEAMLTSCPDRMPCAPEMARLAREVAAYAATGDDAKAQLQRIIDDKLTPYFFSTILNGRPSEGGWTITNYGGRFGNDYERRALVNFGGIWANVPEEVVYYTTHTDLDGRPLSGSDTYALRFKADSLPHDACDAFWSVTLLRFSDYRAVPNALNRFTINNVSGAKQGADGSLTLYIAPELPDGVPLENWLPTPQETELSLTFRVYVPRKCVLDGLWHIPPMIRVYTG